MLATPNRLRGYYGAAIAADQSGDKAKALSYYRRLAQLTAKADTDRVEVRATRQYLAQH